MHLKARSMRYRMNIWLSGRFEGVLEIWTSKSGSKSRFLGVANPRYYFILFTNPSTTPSTGERKGNQTWGSYAREACAVGDEDG